MSVCLSVRLKVVTTQSSSFGLKEASSCSARSLILSPLSFSAYSIRQTEPTKLCFFSEIWNKRDYFVWSTSGWSLISCFATWSYFSLCRQDEFAKKFALFWFEYQIKRREWLILTRLGVQQCQAQGQVFRPWLGSIQNRIGICET